jgi:hypothetical protein
MPLTAVQRGNIGQTEAAKCLMISTDGELECDNPVSDDERRDAEIHRRHHFLAIALQIKTAWRLWSHRKSEILEIPFTVHVGALVSNAHFYYLFGYFDKKAMTFLDPIFLVPSAIVHKHAMPRLIGDRWHFTFQASLNPDARDHFSPYRVSKAEVGKVLLEIIRELEHQEKAHYSSDANFDQLTGLVWVSPRSLRRVARKVA